MNPRRVTATTHDPAAIDWSPLQRVVDLALARDIEVDDTALFMWMGCCTLYGELKVHLYKHIGTRRYVNLDTAGHAYRYRLEAGVGVYETITSPTVALAEVLDVAGESARDSIDRWSRSAVGRPSPSPGLSL
jgi:hypothetical protein